jgi:hypothetical protein
VTARRLTLALLTLWALLWIGSIALPATLAPTGDGFTRGLNRLMAFFGLQIGAGVIGLLLVFIRPPEGRLRWMALVPAGAALLLVVALVALILWSRLSRPDPATALPVEPPATEAAPIAGPADDM